jgi:hypothetical protein
LIVDVEGYNDVSVQEFGKKISINLGEPAFWGMVSALHFRASDARSMQGPRQAGSQWLRDSLAGMLTKYRGFGGAE